MQSVESSGLGFERMDYICRRIAATETRKADWVGFEPLVFRYAVAEVRLRDLPELDDWVGEAKGLFLNFLYTNIDVEYYAFLYSWDQKKDYAECVRQGERYLDAMADYKAGRGNQMALLVSILHFTTPRCERALRVVLAHAYLRDGQPERANARQLAWARALRLLRQALRDGQTMSRA